MLRLPYKTDRKVYEKVILGDTEIGELEISKIGDLSPNERTYIRELSKNSPDLRKLAAKLATDIATKSGKKLLDIYNALTGGDVEELGEYLQEFIAFQDQMEENSQKRNVIMTTAIIKMRICPDWDIENTGNPNEIHPKLVDIIAEFARNEESGWVTSTEPVTEDDLGKSLMETTSNPNGEKSSGESENIGETTEDSLATISDSNQPG